MREHGAEPIPGLPAALPAGETLLWQGAPRFRGLVRRAFHLRKLAIYFVLLLAWYACAAATSGADWQTGAVGALRVTALAGLALGLIALFAWLVSRTTVYSLTNRRLVMRFGVAFPMTLNLPFASIESAGLRLFADGAGDVPLRLLPQSRIAYLFLWPHARPWRMARAEPMLRAVPEAARVAQLLARALAASAEQAAQPAPEVVLNTGADAHATAAAA